MKNAPSTTHRPNSVFVEESTTVKPECGASDQCHIHHFVTRAIVCLLRVH